MRNFDLIENQPSTTNRPHLLVSKESELPKLKDNNVSVLSNIPEAGLAELMRKSKAVRYVKRETISQSNNKNLLCLIFLGKVCVSKSDAENMEENSFHILESSAGFGEIAVLTEELRSVSSINLENAVFAGISISDFNLWLMEQHDVEFNFLPVLTENLNS